MKTYNLEDYKEVPAYETDYAGFICGNQDNIKACAFYDFMGKCPCELDETILEKGVYFVRKDNS